jgi:hypothetical protein
MSKKIVSACLQCGQATETWPSQAKRNRGQFCSRACQNSHRSTPAESACGECGARIETTIARLESGYSRYCSHPCFYAARKRKSWELPRIGARFWPRVDKSGPILRIELGPCWIWMGHRKSNGYGTLGIGTRTFHAHRIAWFIQHGRWPEPMALHKCDGGEIGCVRIDHLFEGDSFANARDRVQKGRQFKGETSPFAKLTERDVIAIRAAVLAGVHRFKIAEQFSISETTVRDIHMRRSWPHVVTP